MDSSNVEQELRIEKLTSGDRPSVLALGVFGAEALKKTKLAVFMVDVLGRVHLVPPSAIQVLQKPLVSQQELDAFDEETAIKVLLAQESSEEEIMKYLRGRKTREDVRDGTEASM